MPQIKMHEANVMVKLVNNVKYLVEVNNVNYLL